MSGGSLLCLLPQVDVQLAEQPVGDVVHEPMHTRVAMLVRQGRTRDEIGRHGVDREA
jgi:hypothetical protein